VALVLVLAATGAASGRDALAPAHHPPPDLVMQASDFHNLATMTKVRGFYVDNRLGHRAQAVRLATASKPGVYPVGTILQLVPQEAMVKRRKGFDPATHDWEFFSLSTTAQGTQILNRGTTSVVNRFGGTCSTCHLAAARFDLVCEHRHGCAPLPISDQLIAQIQAADPRPVVMPTR
jgi:hypothetical protein